MLCNYRNTILRQLHKEPGYRSKVAKAKQVVTVLKDHAFEDSRAGEGGCLQFHSCLILGTK